MIVQFNDIDEYLKAVTMYLDELDAVVFYISRPEAVEAHVFWKAVDYAYSCQSDQPILQCIENKLSREQFARALGFRKE